MPPPKKASKLVKAVDVETVESAMATRVRDEDRARVDHHFEDSTKSLVDCHGKGVKRSRGALLPSPIIRIVQSHSTMHHEFIYTIGT